MGRNSKLFQKRKAATQEALRRKQASRETNKRILIVCEGEKTERIYFGELVAHLKLVSVDVEISADGGSAPISVVNYAEQRARAEGLPDDAGYNAVFCVFDRDSHETYEQAKSRVLQLRKEGVFPDVATAAITSIPSFEYWFILHFTYDRSPYVAAGGRSSGGAVLAALKALPDFANYEKSLSMEHVKKLLSLTETAIMNATKAESDANATGEENPSTRVYAVVQYLVGLSSKAA